MASSIFPTGGVKSTTTTITAAQLATIADTPVETVPSPGAGRIVVPLSYVSQYTYGTRPFSNGGSPITESSYGEAVATISDAPASVVLGKAVPWVASGANVSSSDQTPNTPLTVTSAANFDAGAIAAVDTIAGGSGYRVGDRISSSGGDVILQVVTAPGGVVATVSVVDGSSGYPVGDSLIDDGNTAPIVSSSVNAGGSGYAPGDTGYIESPVSTTISAVNQGTKTFTADGDERLRAVAGVSVHVTGSTGNDGIYTIVSSSYDSGTDTTAVVVAEAVPSAVGDGKLEFVALYTVDTVSAGAVTAFSITNAGAGYTVDNYSTFALTGGGDGLFRVNVLSIPSGWTGDVTAVDTGDGSLTITVVYQDLAAV